MKKWIISASIFALMLLIARPIARHLQRAKDERIRYTTDLQFDFSGKIDSIIVLKKNIGLILFHVTRGNSYEQLQAKEKELNDKIEYNGYLRFLEFRAGDTIEMSTNNPTIYSPGDSICVNTGKNAIIIFRKDKQISAEMVVVSLRKRPWFRLKNES